MPSIDLIHPDGRKVTVEQPALANRLRAQGYVDAAVDSEPEPELSATEPLPPVDWAATTDAFSVHLAVGDNEDPEVA